MNSHVVSRVMVTGASGIIGRATVARLVRSGIEVVALSSTPAGFAPPVHELVADAADEQAVAGALAGCDAVVHLAALAHPSLGPPGTVFGNNVLSTFTVLAQAGAAGVARVVLASSINAFGVPLNPQRPKPAYFPLDEQIPVDIADAYSLSKQVDELSATMAARTWGTAVIAFRFPLVKPDEELMAIAAETEANPAEMMRSGWGYLRLTDAAAAIETALRSSLQGAHVIGLSAEDTLLATPTTELLERYAPGVPRRRTFTGREAVIDTGRARRLLGLAPGRSVHQLSPEGGSRP